jgi:hypothetical protein
MNLGPVAHIVQEHALRRINVIAAANGLPENMSKQKTTRDFARIVFTHMNQERRIRRGTRIFSRTESEVSREGRVFSQHQF